MQVIACVRERGRGKEGGNKNRGRKKDGVRQRAMNGGGGC